MSVLLLLAVGKASLVFVAGAFFGWLCIWAEGR